MELKVGSRDASDVDATVRLVGSQVRAVAEALSTDDALQLVASCRNQLDAIEATVLGRKLKQGASERTVEHLAKTKTGISLRSAKKKVTRAKATAANPDLGDRLESGRLSTEQVDLIADAAERTDGVAAVDTDLISAIGATDVDQGRKLAHDYVRRHTTQADVEQRHETARRLRHVRRWETPHDTHVLAIEGDQPSIDAIHHHIRIRSNQLYRTDGGRTIPDHKHPRTKGQRDFDATVDLLTTSSPTRSSRSGSGDGGDSTHGNQSKTRKPGKHKKHGNSGQQSKPGKPKRADRPNPRATVVVSMTVDQALGNDPTPIQQIGGGLLPRAVTDEALCSAEWVGIIFDQTGQPLHLGRSTRYYTDHQWLALVARDHACVLCGGDYRTCHAHHLTPYQSPAQGPTDIDNAALLCGSCHHHVHDHHLTLYRTPTGTWTTRPATPTEHTPTTSRPRAGPTHQPPNPDREPTPTHPHRRPHLH